VFLEEAMEEAKRKFGGHLSFSGVKVVAGGPRWLDQVAAAAEKIDVDATHVILHDAARPAVPYSDIDALMEAAEGHEVAVLTTPLRTPVVELDEGGNAVANHLPREFQHLLMPQVFSREKFLQLAQTKQEIHASELHLVKGSPLNIRVGGGGDVSMVNAMLRMLPKPKVKPPSSPFEEAQW
jgi:2-C-methyl-D-erythritol 4-phosphate cytidylyltransferase